MKKAFSMLELIFVLVVIGILAAIMLPQMQSNYAWESAIELVSQIRYTQHLAMIDDKFDATNALVPWYRNRWQITFNGNLYSIVSDGDTTFATDPQDRSIPIQNIELENIAVNLAGGCNGQTDITFDHLGRPMVGEINDDVAAYTNGQLLQNGNACVITLNDGTNTESINIEPETGYAHIN